MPHAINRVAKAKPTPISPKGEMAASLKLRESTKYTTTESPETKQEHQKTYTRPSGFNFANIALTAPQVQSKDQERNSQQQEPEINDYQIVNWTVSAPSEPQQPNKSNKSLLPSASVSLSERTGNHLNLQTSIKKPLGFNFRKIPLTYPQQPLSNLDSPIVAKFIPQNHTTTNKLQLKVASAKTEVITVKEATSQETDVNSRPEIVNNLSTEKKGSANIAQTHNKPKEAKAESVTEHPKGNQKQLPAKVGSNPVQQGNKPQNDHSQANLSQETSIEGKTTPKSPQEDPGFQEVANKAKQVSEQEKQHQPATTKATEAQNAAIAPPQEVESKAQVNQVGEMESAPTPAFNAGALKQELLKRIADAAPKTLEEADKFKDNNQLNSVKSQLNSEVKQERENTQKPLDDKAKEKPDTSGIETKEVTPLPATEPGTGPASIGAEKAVPKPKDSSEVETPLKQESKQLDQQMTEGGITEKQLEKSNEPQFQSAIDSKKEAQQNVASSTQNYRKSEQQQLSQAQNEAATTADEKLQGMHGDRAKLLAQVVEQQTVTKGKDEQERAKIAGDIQKIYDKTKTNVEDKLSKLDKDVETAFDQGAVQAKELFEKYVDQKMSDYKNKRYSGLKGAWNWTRDLFLDLPPEVNQFYEQGRNLYLQKMDSVLDNVVSIIARGLNAAKTEVNQGRKKVQNYVEQLPANLRNIGREAASEIQEKFNNLEEIVNGKQDELLNKLSQKYQENLQAIDSRIEELKAANQGLLSKASNAITGVIETITKLKDMLMNVLAKAGDVIGKIIQDPIGFLGNFIQGLKQGFNNFVGNIGKHLQTGLINWLTGAMGETGITIPENLFSLPGIFDLVMQILGMTWNYIRQKAVKMFGEPVVAAMEKGSEIFKVLMSGPKALWQYVQNQFTDLKETVMDAIKDMIITQVITAGIKWILGLLNPVGAFIKAAMAIYEIVMFFINNAARIMDLITAIIDSVSAIANGAIGGAAKLIENALVKAIPVVIGFLASLLGVSGLTKKVQGIIKGIRGRIDKAINAVLNKAKKAVKKFLNKIKKTAKKAGAKVKEKAGQIFEWWKARKMFKNKDGESHTLFFEGKNKSAELKIASTPRVLQDYLKTVKDKNNKLTNNVTKQSNNQKITEIESYIRSIQNEKFEIVDNKRKDKGMSQEAGKKIQGYLDKIAKNLASLEGFTEAVPPTKVIWTKQGEDGKSMIAEPLSIDPGGFAGSQPYQESKLWQKVRVRGGYVRGHLLNHHVHGPGTLENLTPITGNLNSEMEREVESKVKNKVLGENKVVSYKVIAEYGGHGLRTHIPEESQLATALKFELYEMELQSGTDGKNPSNWKKNNKIGVPSSLTHTLPEDAPIGEQPALDLSTATPEKIRSLAGIGKKPSEDIIELTKKSSSKRVLEDEIKKIPGIGKEKIKKLRTIFKTS
jgi:hypothetical protein